MRPCNFFYNVTGEEAERLLRSYGSDGEFLARPSESQPTNFTLSIIRGNSITHVKIQNTGDALDLFGGESFASLADLVQHYMHNPDQLQEKNGSRILMKRPISIPLHEPAALEARAPAAERWFHSNITGQEADQLLTREKQWTFLVRESQRAPGSYVISAKTDDNVVHILIQKNHETGMYHVGGGDEFASVNELLSHYNSNPMVEDGSQRVVHLINLIPSTCVPADAIDERIKLLTEIDSTSKKHGFTEEFEKIQRAGGDPLTTRREGKKEWNVPKNRFKNNVPYDHTRVILRDDVTPRIPTDTDYINANYITVPDGPPLHLQTTRTYISTQGCLPNTVVDFWRMIWQENSRLIVMVTREVERGRSICYQYWPNYRSVQDIRGYYVKSVEEGMVTDNNGDEAYIKRRFMISKDGAPQREIYHMQFVGWPDHGCPDQPESLLKFHDAVDKVSQLVTSDQGPVVVHCSAGIGRTGTFIAIDLLLNQIRIRGRSVPIDVPRTVMCIREQRSDMVQTEGQYAFVYKAISSYIINTNMFPLPVDSSRPQHLPPPPPPVPRRQRAYPGVDKC